LLFVADGSAARAFLASQTGRKKGQRGQSEHLPNAALPPSSARNLHKNPQILGTAGKRAAHWPDMVETWGKSSAFNSGDRDCHDDY
jgi:hypothetical protein